MNPSRKVYINSLSVFLTGMLVYLFVALLSSDLAAPLIAGFDPRIHAQDNQLFIITILLLIVSFIIHWLYVLIRNQLNLWSAKPVAMERR
ncbi:MAG: hypothetical protein V4616_07735 [Bacteroidota bacterium]